MPTDLKGYIVESINFFFYIALVLIFTTFQFYTYLSLLSIVLGLASAFSIYEGSKLYLYQHFG